MDYGLFKKLSLKLKELSDKYRLYFSYYSNEISVSIDETFFSEKFLEQLEKEKSVYILSVSDTIKRCYNVDDNTAIRMAEQTIEALRKLIRDHSYHFHYNLCTYSCPKYFSKFVELLNSREVSAYEKASKIYKKKPNVKEELKKFISVVLDMLDKRYREYFPQFKRLYFILINFILPFIDWNLGSHIYKFTDKSSLSLDIVYNKLELCLLYNKNSVGKEKYMSKMKEIYTLASKYKDKYFSLMLRHYYNNSLMNLDTAKHPKLIRIICEAPNVEDSCWGAEIKVISERISALKWNFRVNNYNDLISFKDLLNQKIPEYFNNIADITLQAIPNRFLAYVYDLLVNEIKSREDYNPLKGRYFSFMSQNKIRNLFNEMFKDDNVIGLRVLPTFVIVWLGKNKNYVDKVAVIYMPEYVSFKNCDVYLFKSHEFNCCPYKGFLLEPSSPSRYFPINANDFVVRFDIYGFLEMKNYKPLEEMILFLEEDDKKLRNK